MFKSVIEIYLEQKMTASEQTKQMAPIHDEYMEEELLNEGAEIDEGPDEHRIRVIKGKFKAGDKRVKMEIIRDIVQAFVDLSKRWTGDLQATKGKPSGHVFGREFADTEHCMFYVMGKLNKQLPVEASVKSVNGMMHVYHSSFPRFKVPVSIWSVYKPMRPNEKGEVEFSMEIHEGPGDRSRNRRSKRGKSPQRTEKRPVNKLRRSSRTR